MIGLREGVYQVAVIQVILIFVGAHLRVRPEARADT